MIGCLILFCLVYLLSFSDDADKIRIHTLAEAGDVDSLQKMVDAPYIEESPEGLSSDAPQGGDSDVDES